MTGLRLTPCDELELRWYTLEAERDLGLRSPFGAALERANAGQLFDFGNYPSSDNIDTERIIAVVRRATRVRNRLRRMGGLHSAALMAHYCAETPPGLGCLNPFGAVSLLTDRAKRAYAAAGRKSRPRASTLARFLATRLKSDEVLRGELLAEGDTLVAEAVSRWGRSKTDG